jgi:hypothetical protein
MSQILYDIAGNALSVGVIMASGLPEKLEGVNPIYNALVTGHVFALADDVYNYASGMRQPLLIQNMEYKAYENKALFNSAVFGVANMTGIDAQVAQLVANSSPLPPNITQNVTLGGMIVAANLIRGALANQPNVMAQYLVNPLSIVGIN